MRIPAFSTSFFFYTLILATAISAQVPSGHPSFDDLTPRQKAEMMLTGKHYAEAIDAYKDILAKGEGDGYVLRGLIKAYNGAGRDGDAEAFLRNYAEAHPGSSVALYGWGFYCWQRGRFDEAEDYLNRALQADPENALALNNLAAAWARKKSFAEAVEKVHRAIALDPAEPLFYANLQEIYMEMGAPERMRTDFEAVLRDGPRVVAEGYGGAIARSLRQESFKLYDAGNIDAAIAKLAEMVEIYSKIGRQSGMIAGLFSLGLLYDEKGDAPKADEYYHEVLKINPQHIQARERLHQNR